MKAFVDSYFFTITSSLNVTRKLNLKTLSIFMGALLVATILIILFLPDSQEKEKTENFASPMLDQNIEMEPLAIPETTHLGGKQKYASQVPRVVMRNRRIRNSAGTISREYSASQLVTASNSNFKNEALPLGSTFKVLLKNRILSSDAHSPIIAEVAEDVYLQNSLVIPRDSQVMGTGYADEATERLQVRFHTVVFPDGDQHSISAMALTSDGASGIPGELHSQVITRQLGKVLGGFVGGVANGLKDRESGRGIAIEPGSLKNGLLNGISQTSLDQAKVLSDSLDQRKSFIEVPAGANFLIYLEKEFGL